MYEHMTEGVEIDIKPRVTATWRNWEKCSGMFCNRRMQVKLKGEDSNVVLGKDKGTGSMVREG